jgi:hypothetical protein
MPTKRAAAIKAINVLSFATVISSNRSPRLAISIMMGIYRELNIPQAKQIALVLPEII